MAVSGRVMEASMVLLADWALPEAVGHVMGAELNVAAATGLLHAAALAGCCRPPGVESREEVGS